MANEDWYALALSIAVQLVAIFGGFFVLGFILSKLQEMTQANYMKAVGWKGILWTAWIGTPVHELGHAIFALLFRHKIRRISLFKPNEETGQLGSVEDGYNRFSVFQNLGNFFVGVGPLIFGSIALAALLHYMVPNQAEIFNSLNIGKFAADIPLSIYGIITLLFAPDNLGHIGFWMFIYLSFAIASHMAPSRADLKRALYGFGTITISLVLVNLVLLYFGFESEKTILQVAAYSSGFLTLMTYALAVSLAHLVLSFAVRAVSVVARK